MLTSDREMSVVGFYSVRPRAKAPLEWFRELATQRGKGALGVQAWPQTLDDLRVVTQAFEVEHDIAAVRHRLDTTQAASAVVAGLVAADWPTPLHGRALHLRRTHGVVPWRELGLKKRKTIVHGTHCFLDLELANMLTWISFTELPTLEGASAQAFTSWRERHELAHVDTALARLGLARSSDLAALADNGLGARLERHVSFGTQQRVFPGECSGCLTLCVPTAHAEMSARVAECFDASDDPFDAEVTATGSIAALLAGAAIWPTPESISAPFLRDVPPTAVRRPEGFVGTIRFRVDAMTGARGGVTEWTLALSPEGARLGLAARGGADPKALAKLEALLDVAIEFEGVG